MNLKNKLNILIAIAGVTISSFSFSDTINCCAQCEPQPGCSGNAHYTIDNVPESGCNVKDQVMCLNVYQTDSSNCKGSQPCNY